MRARLIPSPSCRHAFLVEWYELKGGEKVRRRAYFKEKEAALRKLNKVEAKTWQHGAEHMTLTDDEKAAVLHWRELASEISSTPSLYDFAKMQAEKLRNETGKTLADALQSALRKRKVEKRSERTISELEAHGERLLASLGRDSLVTLTSTDDIDDWLESLALPKEDGGRGLSGTTVSNHRRSAHTIFAEAERRKWIALNPVSDSLKPELNESEIHILEVEDAQRLIEAARGHALLVPLALQLFAGLRTSEVARMSWGSIDRAARVVKDMKSKTRKRIVPFLGCLGEIIDAEPEHAASDSVVSIGIWSYTHAMSRLFRRAGVAKKPNVLRHSFCSYRVADCKSLDQTALEAANSSSVIREHYWRLVTDEQAARYFAISAS